MKNTKANKILKRSINKLFTVENTYDTNQRDKAREQNLRQEAVVIGEVMRKCECLGWGGVFEHYKYQSFN